MKNNVFILPFITALISGVAVFINKFGVGSWSDAVAYTTTKNIIAACLLAGLVGAVAQWRVLKLLNKKQWINLVVIGVIGGSVPFVLFFKSLTLVPATQAAFIHKTLFVWVAVMSAVYLKEKVSRLQWLGIVVMMIGVVMLGGLKGWDWGIGFFLALGATILWAIETIIAKKILQNIPALVGAWARMAFGAVLLIVYSIAQGSGQALIPQTWEQVGWALVTGMVLCGYVACWYTGLKKLSASFVSTVLVLAFPITVVLQNITTGQWPSALIVPMILLVAGAGVFVMSSRQKNLTPALSLIKERETMVSMVSPQLLSQEQGIIRCARYAFSPNRLHFCGPDKSGEMLAYLGENTADYGLRYLLSQFEVMYPYLKAIADANHLSDPLHEKVVEAYWVGNELLDTPSKQDMYIHLKDTLKVKDRFGSKYFGYIEDKISGGAKMHHSFQVMNIWQRMGHKEEPHTVESIDSCRISWGKVIAIDGPVITVERQPIRFDGAKLYLATVEQRVIRRHLADDGSMDDAAIGDWISMHWDLPCERLHARQVANLARFTNMHLALANRTV
ncbi:MAG: hypothetical protein UV70_C0003G0055 [Parcubacteria group bacterium GW2011_GWA2_43_13]|nr:MAG: hypothetical protein UV70_C0003G0055 [Parcubacteria group bacterium GW2011_GWA2_43_13]OGY69361.1 MAG: hypothetical protein A3B94_03550 [Candidatus Jacksonbacteria bacterium RIFCSPHIGHO2_02_FULL_43_10]OGY70582.1 MAG: hypothetical protein A2986_02640 [Candidatus Jacksonbacteria bacterium RIFCSPLOWO2_01_FULL_44_13]HAZ16360.1 hypothetical protein [Candidatus Jacksonbacteria bacterium]